MTASSAVLPWIRAFQDQDAAVRIEATLALLSVDDLVRQTIPALTEALRDEDAAVRTNAAGALRDLGSGTRSAMPSLTEVLQDETGGVRLNLVWVHSPPLCGARSTGGSGSRRDNPEGTIP